MSRRRFSVNDLVPSQSEACDASVPRGAKMPKRASQSGETCRAAKRARNKDDSSARKISSSKLLRTGKQTDGKTPSVFFAGLPSPRLRGLIWAWLRHNNKENK